MGRKNKERETGVWGDWENGTKTKERESKEEHRRITFPFIFLFVHSSSLLKYSKLSMLEKRPKTASCSQVAAGKSV